MSENQAQKFFISFSSQKMEFKITLVGEIALILVKKSYATKVKIAARFSIEEQMEEFRTNNPIQKCSSDPCLYSHEDFGFHVDHVVHF